MIDPVRLRCDRGRVDNAQLSALLGVVGVGLAGVAAAIRWAVNRVTAAIDAQSSSNLRLADAQLELASAHAASRADMDHIMRWIMTYTPKSPPTTANLKAIDEESEPNDDRTPSTSRRAAGPGGRRTPTAGRGVPALTDYPVRREQTGPYRRPHADTQKDET